MCLTWMHIAGLMVGYVIGSCIAAYVRGYVSEWWRLRTADRMSATIEKPTAAVRKEGTA